LEKLDDADIAPSEDRLKASGKKAFQGELISPLQ
jgi:hypothetical protein